MCICVYIYIQIFIRGFWYHFNNLRFQTNASGNNIYSAAWSEFMWSFFVSSEIMNCRLLKWSLDHPRKSRRKGACAAFSDWNSHKGTSFSNELIWTTHDLEHELLLRDSNMTFKYLFGQISLFGSPFRGQWLDWFGRAQPSKKPRWPGTLRLRGQCLTTRPRSCVEYVFKKPLRYALDKSLHELFEQCLD